MANLKALATIHVGKPGTNAAIVGGTVFDPADLPGEAGLDKAEINRLLDRGALEDSDEPLSEQTFVDIPTGPTMNVMTGRPLTLPRTGATVTAPPEPKAAVATDGEPRGPSAGRKPNDPRNSAT